MPSPLRHLPCAALPLSLGCPPVIAACASFLSAATGPPSDEHVRARHARPHDHCSEGRRRPRKVLPRRRARGVRVPAHHRAPARAASARRDEQGPRRICHVAALERLSVAPRGVDRGEAPPVPFHPVPGDPRALAASVPGLRPAPPRPRVPALTRSGPPQDCPQSKCSWSGRVTAPEWATVLMSALQVVPRSATPSPPSRTNWTCLVPPSRTNWTCLVPPPYGLETLPAPSAARKDGVQRQRRRGSTPPQPPTDALRGGGGGAGGRRGRGAGRAAGMAVAAAGGHLLLPHCHRGGRAGVTRHLAALPRVDRALGARKGGARVRRDRDLPHHRRVAHVPPPAPPVTRTTSRTRRYRAPDAPVQSAGRAGTERRTRRYTARRHEARLSRETGALALAGASTSGGATTCCAFRRRSRTAAWRTRASRPGPASPSLSFRFLFQPPLASHPQVLTRSRAPTPRKRGVHACPAGAA
jgi:hypothetical protein